MKEKLIALQWRLRAAPLDPVGMAVRGAAARTLAQRLLARDDAALGRLSGVAAPDLLMVLGEAADLPWVDGAVYLGRDAEAPSLLLPTTREPAVPLPLVERALLARARTSGTSPPYAVLVDPPLLASAQAARPILRPVLQAWLEGRPDRLGDAR
jgi:MoxR-vWA-beta-propeller ternary system domain bpX5